ncbi:LytTR family DNA-binding domain-containing protein [Pediococcus claussenii]|uniref:LytTr DNA-binding domain protein n=1 Tax=Pediococcus claussenii (strain ATCC BAA-344 / DSM 14800 / JCM 18046 / KCTC 3811 / LMG 21948 / P06) TaxID=701521 RepID=G8PBK8_PEDCP|nr:LytTR family DNA-binding domain-containing protein [Pediococcus claussenii]AEV94757.1 lytTr DNA-binding domain protein [Pediococcus claussenii ATCC BAA-344]ANZ69953.1 hypothetical protein AYR57_06340 [Pediococcus claussenii]ANZ71769.1 hypothetical protein AYR58_06340 [Pediococcus claussenii]KRN20936.1 hypothetical protein IV79_GL000161 [Pediococcus claussenii]
MKFRIVTDDQLDETEIIIKSANPDDVEVRRLKQIIQKAINEPLQLIVFQNDIQIFLNADEVLFFETDGRQVQAHTENAVYQSGNRLYELEEILTSNFIRVSKSAILNVDRIYSVDHSVSSNLVHFGNSNKQVYVSRRYYKKLKEVLEEKR